MSDEGYELAIERIIHASPARVFATWRDRLEEWWAPKPWTTEIIEQDFRPGGRSAMMMSGPDGATSPMEGVFLDIVPNARIVFTNAFKAGWIPQTPFMVGLFTFTAEGSLTRYRAAARHWDEAARQHHEAMGFTEGWSVVAAQLAALAEAGASA